MNRKKIGFFILLMAGVLLTVVLFLNPILEKSLDNYLRKKIEIRQAKPTYSFTYEDLDLNITTSRITLTNFRMSPLEEYRQAFMGSETNEKALKELSINEVTIQGIGLMNFLWDKKIDIGEIRIDSVRMDLYVAEVPVSQAKKEKESEGFSLEGINLPGITKLSLGSFILENLRFTQIKVDSRDTLISLASGGGSIEGLGMKNISEAKASFFEPDLADLTLLLNSVKLDLRENLYSMGYEKLKYTFASRSMEINSLSFNPREERNVFREKNYYSYEIYSASLKKLMLKDFELDDYLNQGVVAIREMHLDSLNLEIFRDKTKPFNTARKVKFLNKKMAALKFPLHIGSIAVENSYLKYVEQAEIGKTPLVVDFTDLELEVDYLTSLPDSLTTSKPLKIDLTAKLDRAIPVDINVELPYNSNNFHVLGHTEGASDFTNLNKTVLPAIGLQFISGRLDGLWFDIQGSPLSLSGSLTLLYHDLKVEIHKSDNEKKKTLSWATNALLKKSNPKPNGHTVIGEIHAQRIPYKGLGNFIWKGVQSGIVNSLNPIGKNRVDKN